MFLTTLRNIIEVREYLLQNAYEPWRSVLVIFRWIFRWIFLTTKQPFVWLSNKRIFWGQTIDHCFLLFFLSFVFFLNFRRQQCFRAGRNSFVMICWTILAFFQKFLGGIGYCYANFYCYAYFCFCTKFPGGGEVSERGALPLLLWKKASM